MSSSMGTIYVGDVGTPITLTILDESGSAVDLATADTTIIYLLVPGMAEGGAVAHTASLVSGGSTGQITYSTQAGDVGVAGRWRVQGYVHVTGGTHYRTSAAFFDVLDVI